MRGKGVATLLLFAIPTQPIYAAAFPYGGNEASVLFTLAAGATLAAALAASGDLVRHGILAAGALAVFLWPSRALSGVDFGLGGILLPAGLTLALLAPRRFAGWAVVLLLGLNAHTWRPAGEGPVEKALSDAIVAGLGFIAVVALAWTVRGRPRVLPRYALHLFYPGHLAALALLRAAA
jgi:hypothetical protein